MNVREARVEDARAMAEVHVRAWQEAYRGHMPDDFLDGMSGEIELRAERWKRAIAVGGSDQQTWVAEDESSRIVGIATAGHTRDEDHDGGEVLMINCIAEVYGSGAGQSLFDAACAFLSERGFTHATLWVLEANARARRFYEKNGWRLDGARKADDRGTFVLDEVRYAIDF